MFKPGDLVKAVRNVPTSYIGEIGVCIAVMPDVIHDCEIHYNKPGRWTKGPFCNYMRVGKATTEELLTHCSSAVQALANEN